MLAKLINPRLPKQTGAGRSRNPLYLVRLGLGTHGTTVAFIEQLWDFAQHSCLVSEPATFIRQRFGV